jgi:hypothetical protein
VSTSLVTSVFFALVESIIIDEPGERERIHPSIEEEDIDLSVYEVIRLQVRKPLVDPD